LTDIAEKYLEKFVRKDGFAANRFVEDAIGKAGELRIDRKTVPVVGSLFTKNNNKRLLSALEYGFKGKVDVVATNGLWLYPERYSRRWGISRVLPKTIDAIAGEVKRRADSEETGFPMLSVSGEEPPRHIKEAFDENRLLPLTTKMPLALEMLVVPDLVAAILVHAPLWEGEGIPVPVGIVSFDERIVASAERFLNEKLGKQHSGVENRGSVK
jgi:hypothetical protein